MKTILIVEDDIFIRDIYQMKFSQVGFEVIIAEDGMVALEKMTEKIPDIILLDIMMPRMNGMEVLQKIKENEEWKKIPIIMLTNISEKENIPKGYDVSADEYLIKSHYAPSEVVEKVNSLLNV